MSQNRSGVPHELFRKALEVGLKGDALLNAFLGRDKEDHRKIFEVRVKNDEKAPYVMWGLIPGDTPSGHYRDLKSLEGISFQVNNWGRTQDEAWQVFGLSEGALDQMDISVEIAPYTLLSVLRLDASPIPDNTTSWWQIAATYKAVLSR